MKLKIRKINKNNKGITLVALSVTIIVLLILAGVTIATLTGDNGILSQAQQAKEETEEVEKEEQNILSKYENYINNLIGDVPQVNDSNPGVLEGTGTEQDPFVINSIEDLVVFSYDVTSGNRYEDKIVQLGLSLDFFSDKSYVNANRKDYGIYWYEGKLKEVLTSKEGFKTIGEQELEGDNYFYGIFDGNNNYIKNMYINILNEEKEQDIGFINTNKGIIENLNLVDVKIDVLANEYAVVGSITAFNYGTIQNCFVSGTINGKHLNIGGAYIGGIVGINNKDKGIIEYCSSDIEVESSNEGEKKEFLGYNYGGGICARNDGIVQNCYNKGNIEVKSNMGEASAGGICGRNTYKVYKCYNLGNVKIIEEPFVSEKCGAITGYNLEGASIESCRYNNEILGVGINEENGVVIDVKKDKSLDEKKILELIY